FGSRNRISAGGIQHDNATPRRRLNIHIVYTYSGTADHAKFRSGVQNVRREFGLAAHHQRVEGRNNLDKFALAQASLDRNLQRVITREFVHAALRNRIGNKNLWRSHGTLEFGFNENKCAPNVKLKS